jgi:uncharacterized protein (TIGR03437 family)
MCHVDTDSKARRLLVVSLAACAAALAQTASDSVRPDWRRVGSTSLEVMLASPATGPVDQVWFGPEGRILFARTHTGRVFETLDFENWTLSVTPPPHPEIAITLTAERLPAANAMLRANPADARRIYAIADHLYESEDGGHSWTDLTGYKDESVIGLGQRDLAVSPADGNQLIVANDYGVWRSLDGGQSWSGLNRFLPNLLVRRILALPANGRGLQIEVDSLGSAELPAGGGVANSPWQPVPDTQIARDTQTRRTYSGQLGVEITAVGAAGEIVYAGSADGRIWVSLDRGRTFTLSPAKANGPVEKLFVDLQSPRVALAAASGAGIHVLRTTNTGGFWDDLTANLPDVGAHSITADRNAGAVYVATDRGVYMAHEDLEAPGPASSWSLITGNLPAGRATAAELDTIGNQLYVALEGYGVYAAAAPHRARFLRLVNAADFSTRPAAPGSLVSVMGGAVRSARAGDLEFPILASSDSGTQIQVPFEVNGPSVDLALGAASGNVSLGLAVQAASPAIFLDRDGAPMLLDADSGLMLDAGNTAHSNARIQILATGLGRVNPGWPTGLAAPLENPPAVAANVKAYLERAPVAVTRASLAPGYVGLYLIELQLPAIVNAGPAELYIAADGQESNRVRVYLQP